MIYHANHVSRVPKSEHVYTIEHYLTWMKFMRFYTILSLSHLILEYIYIYIYIYICLHVRRNLLNRENIFKEIQGLLKDYHVASRIQMKALQKDLNMRCSRYKCTT